MDLICNYMCEPKSRNYLGYVTLLSMKAKKAMNIKGELFVQLFLVAVVQGYLS